MENDTSFADLDHFNVIADKFGIHFNSVLRKHVIGTNWEQGRITIDGKGPIFHHPHTIYVKDVCTISVTGPARSVLAEGGDIFMATAKYGKGTVFAMIDPWLYNEYTDGRKLPAEYDNYAAGKELVRWILEQVPTANSKRLRLLRDRCGVAQAPASPALSRPVLTPGTSAPDRRPPSAQTLPIRVHLSASGQAYFPPHPDAPPHRTDPPAPASSCAATACSPHSNRSPARPLPPGHAPRGLRVRRQILH